ncbi:cation diffusion facilitator family transporter [Kitasatospora nipponensis]|uniref:Cation diffusion facilitator family transporter n=1 Tax=Kitasatospora nipponensis TaxID=258049 RepID=A0ABN1T969_9ACTN
MSTDQHDHQQHPHPHAHPQDHAHDHDHSHDHGHPHPRPHRWSALRHRLAHALRPHSHQSADQVDAALEASADGLRTLWVSLAVLALTAAVQALVAALSGSVALLGDTVHNAADALTAVPLAVAFLLGRRAATRRFTYGFGRAEDLAGVAVVLTIAVSAVVAGWIAVDRLAHPQPVTHLPAVAAAALAGFVGNEWVARYRIRTGRRIGSAALVADGLPALADGFTSLAVLLGAGAAALGLHLADPLVGLLITVALALVLRDAAREVWRRLMDAVDPALVDTAEAALHAVDGVRGVPELRLRWLGHRLRAEVAIEVDGTLSVRAAHRLAVEAEHALLHALPRLAGALVHADPAPTRGGGDPHAALAHHHPRPDHPRPDHPRPHHRPAVALRGATAGLRAGRQVAGIETSS